MMYSDPPQATRSTQTEPQPIEKPKCVPLMMVDTDGKKRYCYHGGKCRCQQCDIIRQKQLDELDVNLDEFIPHYHLHLEPTLRQVKQKQYSVRARYTSPEMGEMLLKDHLRIVKEIPIYYLPDKYYTKYVYDYVNPQEKGTQTEILIGNYGVDGCPCAQKNVCWDI
ncbi:hypothetical protein AWZ03_010540 [Drosophila navojoa]|uniref:Uncharacterized protein n=1 Tax=Drosophila navojoa TaxID=7232 RepID=A0A484B2R4_DRONA|nr:uncharacterized protein LOC108655260 [Drosophila navojoa]TDG43018.1 hypothetical protein AWZ03_010540 [Drosophila navojoa]